MQNYLQKAALTKSPKHIHQVFLVAGVFELFHHFTHLPELRKQLVYILN